MTTPRRAGERRRDEGDEPVPPPSVGGRRRGRFSRLRRR
ncbi:hypothetical protein Ae168Ps1_4026 [Pseudonocardia sp. Ae168_Ps1]|nr:hypothetical protein Ae150APs1_4000 [Pseudonocardia sp. Ae150A_Ps1]OLL81620.1 hypothetical protein Ae168Ps1_4026 [Pseudonocardia sp. Ae168_Ps1]OLL84266.1 hypothetical protein Ae263Ps1_1321c [Pseudonocardia sp. Ae263_Ps1]OLL95715.1 hypothetical protein Ae356Ps1_5612 [Pseudonocardia sp. Ae356_Ps1]